MTLALAVFNRAGAVLAADGLATYGYTVGSQQLPANKLAVIGDRCAAAQVGNPAMTVGLIEALQASALGSASTLTGTAGQWLEVARGAISTWTKGYMQNTIWMTNLPLEQQFPAASILLAGVAADRSFAYSINWTGIHLEPDSPHFRADGAGATTARIYLDAYSYFRIEDHPVLTLESLAARVMEKVAGNNMEIGGELSLIAVHRETSPEHPRPVEVLSTKDPKIRSAIDHWEIAEQEIPATLLGDAAG